MGKSRRLKFLIALSGTCALATGAIGAAGSQSSDPQVGNGAEQHVASHKVFTGGPITYKQAATSTDPIVTNRTSYVAVPLGNVRVPILPGKTGLINVRFHAESRCTETGGVGESNWCDLRILIGGVEGYPQNSTSGSPLAFDSTDNGSETVASWESHATESHRCIRNTTTTTMVVVVQLQWRVTNFGGEVPPDVPDFWLDDWSLVAERSDDCGPVDVVPA